MLDEHLSTQVTAVYDTNELYDLSMIIHNIQEFSKEIWHFCLFFLCVLETTDSVKCLQYKEITSQRSIIFKKANAELTFLIFPFQDV